jgi:hypothetical protein
MGALSNVMPNIVTGPIGMMLDQVRKVSPGLAKLIEDSMAALPPVAGEFATPGRLRGLSGERGIARHSEGRPSRSSETNAASARPPEVSEKPPERVPKNIETQKLPRPIPEGVKNQADFGKIINWGTGSAQARERIKTVTREELEAKGVKLEHAEYWRDIYKTAAVENPENPSAPGRFELMQHIVRLFGGK